MEEIKEAEITASKSSTSKIEKNLIKYYFICILN